MKKIGTAENLDILLQCSQYEYNILCTLNQVASGKSLYSSLGGMPREPLESTLTPAFKAILEWIDVKDRANALTDLANRMHAVLGETEPGEDQGA